MTRVFRTTGAALLLLLAAVAFAQTPPTEVSYSENFQSYKTQANPPGWIDTSVGNARPEALGLYKTWPEPLDKKSGTVVYGTRQSSGTPEGRNPRIGAFSTLSTYTFNGQGRFEYSGRVLRTTADARVGLTFFSSYPQTDRYYLIGLWSQPSGSNLTMQLFGFGAGTPAGTVDSNTTLDPNKWYRFLIQVDDADGATKIRARFWPEGTTEPETFSIDATDASEARLRSGRIGLWTAVKGEAYIDDLSAKSPVDHSAPAISLFESGQPLPDGAKFNRDAVPEIRVTDDLSGASYTATLDGQPYTSLTPVTVDGWHVLAVTAIDGPRNVSTLQINFLVDKTAPLIELQEGLNPLPANAIFNRDVVLNAAITDVSETTLVATLDGQPYTLGTPVTAPGTHTITVEATDAVGWKTTAGPQTFTIDKSGPALTITSHQDGAVLTTSRVVIAGGSDDAVTVTVAGTAAVVDVAAKTFASLELPLLEGENVLLVTATDAAGNSSTATIRLHLDTRAPSLAITAPAADACVDTAALQVSGTASDPRLDSVKVTIGLATVAATINPNGTFTASVPVDEGKKLITVEATDRAGHIATASRSVIIDRTAPTIDIRESGEPFTGGVVNRAASFVIVASEGDVAAKLDGAPYTSGTSVEAEGTHTLAVTATDCAGHKTEKSVEITIDRKAPTIRDVAPANGATVGTLPNALSGTTDTDVVTVTVVGTNVQATPGANGAFSIAAPFAEGVNRFTLEATDRAGNRGSLEYSVTVKTSAPIVEIRESGAPIAEGALYNRAVTPVVRSVDPAATISATLNSATYTSGTTISADGSYTLRATATDAVGHSGTAQATFTIDRTPPAVDITAPAPSTVQSDRVTVTGTAGDAVTATLNGQPLTLGAGGAFVFENFPLDVGLNALVVTGHDRAGNAGRDEVQVTRDDLGAGVLLTYPPDLARTNRPTTDVIGRLLTPGKGTVVTVGTTPVEVDPTGLFRLSGYELVEGENTITVTATAANGSRTTASVRVTGDFTPPSLAILESGQPLADGARFAERAVITLQSSDSAGNVVNTLTIDGAPVTPPVTISAAGGHSLLATARDLAGNEARVERTLFIGAGGGTATCTLGAFDPANNAVVLDDTVMITGRSGGAIGVKVNGVRANMADGSFTAVVELPVEGANSVTITCTDADGNPTGAPETLTLVRVTGSPSITITSPAEDFVTAQETITVSGTVGPGVVSADVNGVAATITGTTFSVANVRLAAGLNLLVAHAKNAGGRIGTASRRGVYLKDAPSIAISAPSAGAVTGSNKVTVSGTFTNLDPSTVVVSNVASGQTFNADVTRLSDTTGSFTATGVTLASGEQTLRVSGRDRMNREAAATVAVRLTAGTPSITITSPSAHEYFGGGSDSVTVTGTFSAATGSLVDVNGVSATLSGSSYSASVKFSTLAGGITPIVARVTQPDGASATASTVITQLTAAPAVVETFPAANAVEVDTGALMLVLFSQPMERASVAGAFRLEDQSGAPVSGSLYLDKDVLTFAPSTLLAPGSRYTLRISTAAKNLAGTALANAGAVTFTTATTAPAAPPAVNAPATAVCGQSLTVTGTAAPGARLRLEVGTLTLGATADASGNFTFTYPLSGQSGFLVLRVRVVGSDGSLSPAADVEVRVDCSGPQVLSAAYDRLVNKLTIQFSEPVDASTVNTSGAIVLTLDDGRIVAGTATVAQTVVTVTPAENLGAKTFALSVNTTVKDTIGNPLTAPFSQTFTTSGDQPVAGDGSGFISGEVYDATTGRPLAGASITIAVPAGAPIATNADARGRYLARLREGAHTIKASLAGYTSVWRQIVVPPGAGAIPIDIRLTRRGDAATAGASALSVTHGGDTAVTKPVALTVPAGALTSGRKLTLTSIGGQALIGLLPLGWSPIAAAEVAVDGSEEATPLAGAQLTFQVPLAAVTAAAQNLTAVHYDAVRDEWRVLASAVNIAADGKAAVSIPSAGAYALVYPDKAAGLTQPPLPVAGDVLAGVPAAAADVTLTRRDFTLDPPIVLPTGRTVATLRIEGAGAAFPSGTAVQAYIDEELKLADGTRLLDPPFATDLLLYRTLTGDLGVADFHLAPSPRAAEVILEVGVDHIRVFPYPGRLDRGTLIGPEGGRVPADDKVSIEIATGAVSEPLRATATSLSAADLAAIGTIAGFRVVGGFHLTLQRAAEPAPTDLDGDGQPDEAAPPQLFIPARATFTVDAAQMPAPTAQVILAELLDQTSYGRLVRLAVPMMLVDPTQTGTPALRFTTVAIDRSVLPVDGVTHEGRYVLLAAEAPIAFATGVVRLNGATGRLLSDARVLAAPLGVAELTRATGIYNIPVPAKPAGPFTLLPRHTTTGDGTVYTHAAAVDPGSINRVDLHLVPQPPVLGNVTVMKGEPPSQAVLSTTSITTDVSLTTNIRASFSPGIDPGSITADAITVVDSSGRRVDGTASADGTLAVVWTIKTGDRLKPNASYIVTVASSIRGSNGATLARGATFNFNTVTEVLNSEIRRERIRITIPDENGLSRITGAPGAIPAGYQAVAIRRERDFLVRYQATSAGDGSFSFVIGNGGDPADKVTMADVIDLQIVSNIGNVVAIFALTPFTSEDGKSFVVPAGAAIRYTSPEGFTLDVPAGAFDEPTVITMTAMKKDDFNDIERLDEENGYLGSVNIDFEGTAKLPLGFEAPIPAGYDTAGKTFVIAQKGMSPVGPRLALIDLMQVRGDKLVIDHDNVTASAVVLDPSGRRVGTQQTLTGSKFSKYLLMLIRGGAYMYHDIKVYGIGGAVGFAAMQGLQASYDLMWDIYWSYYTPHIHVTERGGAIIPIITGRPFTVTGFDPGTGLQAISRTYDPLPFGEPGSVSPIPSPEKNYSGPYPIFGGPFRVETLDLEVEKIDIESIRNFRVRLENGSVQVSPGSNPLDGDIKVTVLNVSRGSMTEGTAGSTMSLPADAGQRIVLLIEEQGVDSRSPVSVIFNEPIFVGNSTEPIQVDQFLRNQIKVAYAPKDGDFSDITPQVRFSIDSGKRRVHITMPSAMQSEARYKVTLLPEISDIEDDQPGLSLGVGTIEADGVRTAVGGGNEINLFFDIRKPAGSLQSFTAAPHGLVRGMELAGNVLFVAAQDGGLRSFDVSNPAGTAPAMGYLPGPPESGVGHLSVIVDRHNRVYATAQQPASGAFRSYRVEDFLGGGTNIPIMGSKLINWKIGFSQGLGLPSNTLLSDIPESIPFRIKVVMQDDEQEYASRQKFVDGAGASETADYPNDDMKSYTVTVPGDGTYHVQRITVENVTLDMRWSADSIGGGGATIHNVVARSTDKMRVVKNQRTYAIVAHLGYGIAVYDANAIEHNTKLRLSKTSPTHIREQLVLTNGVIDWTCINPTPDYGIKENYITTDAELAGDDDPQKLFSYSVDTYRGVLDLQLRLPSDGSMGTRDDTCEQRPTNNTGGLLFQTSPRGHEAARMQAVRGAIAGAAGREPFGHFGMLARYQWAITAEQNKFGTRGIAPGRAGKRDYLLVAGAEYGLIVVEVGSDPWHISRFPLLDGHIADVIWIPGGVHTVRAYPNANVAVVGDRYGRVVIVDLSRIDERWDAQNRPFPAGVFPTLAKALQGPSDGYGIGGDDPRIVWKSEPGVHMGAAAPVLDPYTGMVFATSNLRVRTFNGIDPKVEMKVNLGEPGGLSPVSGVVPLGLPLPKDIERRIAALPACDGTTLACKDEASLAAFKLEVSLPGNMVDELDVSENELRLAVESERIIGAVTEQTPDGFPRSHLRHKRRNGSSEAEGRAAAGFKFKRVVPDALASVLKSQRGYNKFVSPWIVAIADPRASEEYDWQNASTKQEKKDAGCDECERPQHLKEKQESDDVYELYTNGRYITVRPEKVSSFSTIFDGTRYGYLGEDKRLLGRFATVIADTVRPTETLSAAQNPPIADGFVQDTVYLHSGEYHNSTVDLDAGGRAGFSVVADRSYRSGTIGGSFMGQGWDSSLFRRLRGLPNGDVELRTSDGELFRFRSNPDGGYFSPKGLFLKLTRTERGWILIDQKWRISEFDDHGRILSESDEFFDPQVAGSGNIIRYLYDASGRLSAVIDPVKRVTRLTYYAEDDSSDGAYPGMVRKITDWRNRSVEFLYDSDAGTLLEVQLPETPNRSGGRPAMEYTYNTQAGNSFSDKLELRSNIETVTMPHEAAGGGGARIRMTWGTGGLQRDRMLTQDWGSGESVSVTYDSKTSVSTSDALNQARKYTLTENPKTAWEDRAHVTSLTETGVTTSSTPMGQLPSFSTDPPATTGKDRSFSFSYNEEGLITSSSLSGVRSRTASYQSLEPQVAGMVLTSITTTPAGGGETITNTIEYQSGANSGTFQSGVRANAQRVERSEMHRKRREAAATNGAVTEEYRCTLAGLAAGVARSGGTGGSGSSLSSTYTHADENAAEHERGQPKSATTGALSTTFDYPGQDVKTETDARGVTLTTNYDPWRRPRHVTASGPGVTLDERFEFDASGRLVEHSRKQGGEDVNTTFTYDAIGRRTGRTMTGTASGPATTTVAYSGRTILLTQPGGMTTTITVDGLGRPITARIETGGDPIIDYYAFDLDGNLVFKTDTQTAQAWAYDGHGRQVGEIKTDGTRQTAELDAMGNPRRVIRTSADGDIIEDTTYVYTDDGKLQSATSATADGSRTSSFSWDSSGRKTGVSVEGRAAQVQYDSSGRLSGTARGAGSAQSVTEAYERTTVGGHSGTYPQQIVHSDRGGSSFAMAVQFNTVGVATTTQLGDLQWLRESDEAGNITHASEPNRPAETRQYDSRGAVTSENLPGGGANSWGYNATGAPTSYSDPSSQITSTQTDLLGRPTRRSYADGTTEIFVWKGRRVQSVTDRAGRVQSFVYDRVGRISQIHGAGGLLDEIGYDGAGRIISWQNKHSVLEFAGYDVDGNVHTTRQRRLRGGSTVDQYFQSHDWDVHGDRVGWTMPSYEGLSAAGWTQSVTAGYDHAGNMTSMQRQTFGAGGGQLYSAQYAGIERPLLRNVTTTTGTLISRIYQYNASSLLAQLTVTAGDHIVAGSLVTYDGLQKRSAQLLGLSGGQRSNRWDYDGRSRLTFSNLARETDTTPASETYTAADFRTSLDRPVTTPVDPPPVQFEESAAGHQIARVQRGAVVEQFAYVGGERTADGRYTYQYDEKSRLILITEKPRQGLFALRRIHYEYAGNDRMIGRRAEYAEVNLEGVIGPWKPEDRAAVLAADQLPADTTFVWDPVADRLVSIFKAGASQSASEYNGGLLRQIIHGEAAYDDPIEVAVNDPSAPSGVSRLYPVYDEAGAGSLQVILNERGEIVSRSVPNGPYNEDEVVLLGSAVDRVGVQPVRDENGTLTNVRLEMRLTETIDPASAAAGSRLAVTDAEGNVIRTSAAQATASGASLTWSLTAAEWAALTDTAPVVSAAAAGQSVTPHAISVGVTSSLRSKGWSSSATVLWAPAWAVATRPVFSSASIPVEVREPIANLTQVIDGTARGNLYDVPNLGALGLPKLGSVTPVHAIVSSTFHAQPFHEPATGKSYARGRWFDSQTGTWLTPDPRGYRDSSNLYAYAGGDPVNRRDPTGQYEEDVHHYLTRYLAEKAGFDRVTASLIGWSTQELDMGTERTAMPGFTPSGFMAGHDNMIDFHMVTPDRLNDLRLEAGDAIQSPGYDPTSIEHCSNKDDLLKIIKKSNKWRAVGNFLHALEDSFSHQRGLYDRDFTRRFDTWLGHMRWGHIADHTWRRPELAMKMAEETFNQLKALCAASRGAECKSEEWSQISGTVSRFINYNPAAHGEMTWEYQGPVLVRNVRDYQNKVDELESSYEIEALEREGRLAKHQTFMRLHPFGEPWVKEERYFNLMTEILFAAETRADRRRGPGR